MPGVVEQLMEDKWYRNALILELSELEAFLDTTISQEASRSSSLTDSGPASAQNAASQSPREMLSSTRKCLAAFTSQRALMLTALKSSSSYQQRIATALQRTAEQEAKFERLQSTLLSWL